MVVVAVPLCMPGGGGSLTIFGVMGLCPTKGCFLANFSLIRECLLTKFFLNRGCILTELSLSRGYIFSNISLSKGCNFSDLRFSQINRKNVEIISGSCVLNQNQSPGTMVFWLSALIIECLLTKSSQIKGYYFGNKVP